MKKSSKLKLFGHYLRKKEIFKKMYKNIQKILERKNIKEKH